jgi:WD40 repeat protein
LGVSLFFAALVLIAVLSVMFARTARRHADELSDALFAVQKSEALSRQSDETARREELRAREAQRQSDRVAARLALANALSLAELGSVDRALFEMLRALEIAPADPDLESLRRVVRTNLVAWQRQTPTLLYAFNLPGTLPTRAQLLQSGDGGDRNLFLSKRGDHGAFVTVGYDRMIRRWSFGSGTAIGPAFRLSKNGVAMSVSGDGKRLATSRVKNEIQNLETGEIASAPVTQHERDGQRVFTPMCFAGASVIATTSENPADQGKFCFWDEHTAREFPIRLSLGLGDCYEVIEGKDGQPLLFVSRTSQAATTPDPRLEAWDLRTGVRLTFPFPLPDIDRNAGSKASGRYFVALPLGERLRPQLYTDRQGPICTWDLDTGKLACPPWTSPVAPVYQLLTGEGRVLAVQCRDDRIRLFDLETGQQLGGTLTIPGMVTSRRPSPTSLGMALSTGGDVLVTLDRDCTVRGWDLNEVLGQARHAQRHLPSYLPPDRDSAPSAPVVAVTQDGSRVFFGRGDTGHVIDTQTRQPVGPGIVHPVLNRAHFSPDGNYLATATTATPRGDPPIIRIWDLRGDPVAVYESPKFIYGLRYSPDSRLLAVTGVGGTVVLNAHDGKVVRTLREQSCAVNATFSPDGRLLAVAYQEGWEGNGAGRRIWTVETGEPASAFLPADDHSYGAAALEFAANGHALLSLDPATNEVLRFDSADTKNAGTKLSANRPNMMAAWPALDLIATANAGGSLEVWTILDGRRRWVAPSSGEVRRLQLSPDGKTLAVVGSDQSVRLWDTATGWTLGPPFLHPAEIADLAFSSDGEALVTATRAGQVFRWSVPRPMSGSTLECSAAIERKLGMAARSGELVLLKPQEWQSIALPRGGSAGSSTP